LVKDRQLLSAEVMREYDQRFVYRRVFASRVDRGTQTNEGEFAPGGPKVRREVSSKGPVPEEGLDLNMNLSPSQTLMISRVDLVNHTLGRRPGSRTPEESRVESRNGS